MQIKAEELGYALGIADEYGAVSILALTDTFYRIH
jgi:hypothetical protein